MENKYGIILDGRMDEPIWETVETHTGFHKLNTEGGALVEWQTFFKILPVEDRIFVGVKCCENNEMDKVWSAATEVMNITPPLWSYSSLPPAPILNSISSWLP